MIIGGWVSLPIRKAVILTLIRSHPPNRMNNYIVRSYRDVIVVTNIATRRTSKP